MVVVGRWADVGERAGGVNQRYGDPPSPAPAASLLQSCKPPSAASQPRKAGALIYMHTGRGGEVQAHWPSRLQHCDSSGLAAAWGAPVSTSCSASTPLAPSSAAKAGSCSSQRPTRSTSALP